MFILWLFHSKWVKITWVITAYFNIFFCFQIVSEKCMVYAIWPNNLIKNIFGVVFIWIQFIIPILILIYCYGHIVWVLSGRISTKPQPKQDNILTTQTNTFQVAKTNTIKTFLLVAICFVICWSNNQTYYFMYYLGYPADWSGTYSQFSVLMVFLNCTVNLFIYLIKYRDYQIALKKICRCNGRDHKT